MTFDQDPCGFQAARALPGPGLSVAPFPSPTRTLSQTDVGIDHLFGLPLSWLLPEVQGNAAAWSPTGHGLHRQVFRRRDPENGTRVAVWMTFPRTGSCVVHQLIRCDHDAPRPPLNLIRMTAVSRVEPMRPETEPTDRIDVVLARRQLQVRVSVLDGYLTTRVAATSASDHRSPALELSAHVSDDLTPPPPSVRTPLITSPGMHRLRVHLKVSPLTTRSTVLTGPTGSGCPDPAPMRDG